jgi:predicted enzyme related to lactoylglutathione lyase
MANAINWFEIPVTNFERASKFYSTVLGGDLHMQEAMGTQMGFLPADNQGVGGAICAGKDYKPSTEGAFIYLNGGEDLSKPLAKVEQAGGKVLLPKTKISDEIGYMAHFLDTEGNKLAFHSPR